MPGGSGGNFFNLKLHGDTLFPSGPLEMDEGENLAKLFVWIYQLNEDGSGASLAVAQFGGFQNRAAWAIPADPEKYDGRFRRGPITCMAMAVFEEKGRPRPYWWSETLMLVEAAKGECVPYSAAAAARAYARSASAPPLSAESSERETAPAI